MGIKQRKVVTDAFLKNGVRQLIGDLTGFNRALSLIAPGHSAYAVPPDHRHVAKGFC